MIIIVEYNNKYWEGFRDCVIAQWSDDSVISENHRIWCYEYMNPFWYKKEVFHNTDYITMLAINENNHVIGYAVLKLVQNYLDILVLYVEEDWRGTGVGRQFKEAFIEYGESLGVEYIQAINRYDNEDSYKLNVRNGWDIVKVSDDYYRAVWRCRK